MCASAAPVVDRGLQSALRRSGDEGGGGSAAGASPRASAGSPGPKRVTFALPPPPTGTLAAAAAAAYLQPGPPGGGSSGDGGSGGGGGSPAAPHRLQAVRTAVAADDLLCFMPEVDSPHRPMSPLGPHPLTAAHRWPSNEVGWGVARAKQAGKPSGCGWVGLRAGFTCRLGCCYILLRGRTEQAASTDP